MKKNLRLFLVAALAMFSFNAMADDADAVIDFAATDAEGKIVDVWGIGQENVTVATSYTYDGMTITLTPAGQTSNKDNYFRWYTSGNILLGKQGATLQLPAFNFDVARIDVVGTSGASTSVKQNIYVGDEAVSTETTGAKNVTNMYLIDDAYQTAGTVYTLKVTSAHNTQITRILIYKKGSQAKQPAGISWSKASQTVTINADDNVYPELNNPHNLPVTYDSSKSDVATINANGSISLVAAGNTVISAIFAGDDTYETSTVTYTLTVKEAIDPDAKGQINNPYTVAEALAEIEAMGIGKTAAEKTYTKGKVVAISEIATSYKNATFTISDDGQPTSTVTVFRAKGLNNADITDANYIQPGDNVVIYGKLQNYNQGGTSVPEISSCYIYSINGDTGIDELKAANAKFDGKMYNAAGQLVNKGYKGLVIMNGKKVVLK